ncbi:MULTISPECIES: hypothetical protein [unclassified Shewanella]|jgi:hypothetical protein|nr:MULTISPECIES: hypothetical protein [unclassified Shewanella]
METKNMLMGYDHIECGNLPELFNEGKRVDAFSSKEGFKMTRNA